jgi:hypothetical protein
VSWRGSLKDREHGFAQKSSSFGMFAHSEVAYAGGAATWCFIIPEKHLKVIVLTNLQGSSPSDLAADIMCTTPRM